MAEKEEMIFEGIGNELIWTCGFLLATGIALFVFLLRQEGNMQEIHPEQEEIVERTRQQLRETDSGQENHDVPIEDDNNAEQIQCPVCLGTITYPVETNCGHKFCAQCVLAYWQADRWPRACRCPVCRREVTLLLSNPWYERSGRYPDLTHQIQDYNLRMSGQMRPLLSYLYDLPTLLRHLLNDLFTVGGLLCIHRLHILLVLILLVIYIFIPFDILPESFIGLLGYIDDFIILLGAIVYITLIYRAYVTNRTMM